MWRAGSVQCAWDLKATVMRQLAEAYKTSPIEAIDGLKVHLADGAWVHISPHIEKPAMEIVVEANSQQLAEEIVQQTLQQIGETIAEIDLSRKSVA